MYKNASNNLEKKDNVSQNASKSLSKALGISTLEISQKAAISPFSLSSKEVLQLQRSLGNRAVTQLFKSASIIKDIKTTSENKTSTFDKSVIQKLSLAEFVDNTKQTILGCIPWGRAGDAEKLRTMDNMLTMYEQGKVSAQDVLNTAGRLHEFMGGNAKLNAALRHIMDQAREQIRLQPKEQERPFLELYPVAATAVQGIDLVKDDARQKLQKLLQNYKRNDFNFTYSMAATTPNDFLSGRSSNGDCSTLARSFKMICEGYLGIMDVQIGSESKDFFVPNGGRVLDKNGATGNVENGKHWVFTSHYWVMTSAGDFDLLFLSQAFNKGNWIYKTAGDDDTRTFNQYRVTYNDMMSPTLAKRYKLV